MSSELNCYATKGNLNNHIGVPLSLLEINAKHEVAIIEMGANHQKEIEFLCNIVKPNYGVITNIGTAHLEGFKDLDGITKTKNEKKRECCLIVFRAVSLSNQRFCMTIGRGDPQTKVPGGEAGRLWREI